MADEQSTTERLLTGDDIIQEILRNCEQGLFKIRNTTLLPCIYRVFLHPSDYDLIRPVIPALTAESRAALIERLEEWNRKSQPSAIARKLGFESGKTVEYKILEPDWTIEFQPDPEDRLEKGELEIYSELASIAQPSFEGEKTRVITRRLPDGQYTSRQTTAPLSATSRGAEAGPVFAHIRYEDASGPQVFPVTKDRVVIGRGGKTYWVDVKLTAPPDVSREHCRIRRDPATGGFFLKDVSQFGVSINGERIASSIEDRGGEQRDLQIESPLPDHCVIGLADVFFLNFEKAAQP